MKLKDIVSQLANRINQPHVIEVYLRQVYAKGFADGSKESSWISIDDRENPIPNDENILIRLQDGSVRRYDEE